jgi:cyclophilin family peptidyl-prolyl cis-trans isomerase
MRSSAQGRRPPPYATALAAVLAAGLATGGCKKGAGGGAPSGPEGGPPGVADPRVKIARAEDGRRAQDVPAETQKDHDVTLRRLAARAFARILGPDDGPLVRALQDDDPEVAGWGAYGLGESCKGRADAHVGVLAARLVSLEAAGAARSVDVALRALGRCGGDAAEQTLRAWLRAGSSHAAAAALGLGDAAALRGALSLETSGALLDAALGTTVATDPRSVATPLAVALYPFGRVDGAADEGLAARLVGAARSALGRPGPDRIFAVRALGRAASDEAPGELEKVLASAAFTPQERAEAARALARLHSDGQSALADALATIVPDKAARIDGDAFGVLLAAVQAVGEDPPKKAEPSLWTVARFDPPAGAPPAVLRRASAVRCAAAAKLARGAWESDIIRGCDVSDGEAGERARVESLDRSPFNKARRAAWAVLARSAHPRVREAALELVGKHPELGDTGRAAIAEALASDAPGVVAVAAEVVQAHPDRVLALAESERRAALDPTAPPPSPNPAREIDPAVAKALRAAVSHPWSKDLVETRVALVDATLAAGLPEGLDLARAACKDENTTVRARAAKALAGATADPRCPPQDAPDAGAAAPAGLPAPVHIIFDTDDGALGVRLDPAAAPVAASRIAALARSGFYTGIAIHRVVEGFVVQLGDRGGDGYGGSGDTLRCETAPLPFAPLDVGLALAGRDTGSSQIFITLARYPHLDGEYPWLGRADGDWAAVAEGDVIRAVRVED